jgi:hypothetical protein
MASWVMTTIPKESIINIIVKNTVVVIKEAIPLLSFSFLVINIVGLLSISAHTKANTKGSV